MSGSLVDGGQQARPIRVKSTPTVSLPPPPPNIRRRPIASPPMRPIKDDAIGDPAVDWEDPRIEIAEYERDHPMDDPGEADHAAEREFSR